MAQIGCGSMGSGNMNSFLSLGSQVQVIAVCDVDSGHLDSAKNRVNSHYNNSDCRTYKDFRELLAKEQLDIVSHALPDHWHALVSVACAKQGIDIYGEKPLARTIGEGRAICDAVKRYKDSTTAGSTGQRFDAAELVINGRIGKVDYVEVGLLTAAGPNPSACGA